MNSILATLAIYSPLFVCIIWGITLFVKNYRLKKPPYYMVFVLLSALFIFIGIAPFYHNNFLFSLKLDPIFYFGLFTIFPFIYFYILKVTTYKNIVFSSHCSHFIIAILFLFNSLLVLVLLSPEEQKMYVLGLEFNKDSYRLLNFFVIIEVLAKYVFILQIIFYLYKTSQLISSYKARVKDYFSNIKGKYYNWIHVFYVIYIVSAIVAIPPLLKEMNI